MNIAIHVFFIFLETFFMCSDYLFMAYKRCVSCLSDISYEEKKDILS